MKHKQPSLTKLYCIGGFLAAVYAFADTNLRSEVDAILVTGSAQSAPVVQAITGETDFSLEDGKNALLFLPPQEPLPERWTTLQNETSLEELQADQLRSVSSSRAFGATIADAIPTQTVQLEQLQVFVANRSLPQYSTTTIFSPADGSTLLNPQPTFRRLPVTDTESKAEHYPTVVARIFSNNQQVLEIPFAEGQRSVTWDEIPNKPEGLSPGDYVIRIAGSNQDVRFTVKPVVTREWMNQRITPIESLLGNDDPISVQVAAEMLAQDTIDGPFYTDALDRIAALPKDQSTPYLEGMSSYLTFRLSGREGVLRGGARDEQEQAEEKEANENPTADAAFIHRLLLNEKWNNASQRLDGLTQKLSALPDSIENRELAALCHLYRGMILAESGMTQWQDGYAEFMQALEILDAIASIGEKEAQTVADSRFQTANNFGNYLLRLTQDRLNNHALAIATGDGSVLTAALFSWTQALDAYNLALSIAETSLTEQPELAATSKVNLARLYALLGDIVRTVGQDSAASEIEKGAFSTAEKLAREVIDMKLANEDRLSGAAHHLLADIAFRRGDKATSRTEAEAARAFYVRTGTLSGVEAIERLLGMADTTDRTTALKHLSISNALSEVLREQIPADQIGLSRAGFFARRAYVSERLIELLIQEGKPIEALVALESSKGRSLKDVLAAAGINDDSGEVMSARTVQEILADFPQDIAAVEYFIGSENCWGFLIIDGKVESFPIRITPTQPSSPREIVEHIQKSLFYLQNGLQIMRGGDYGRDWEQSLYTLRNALLPDYILARLRESKPEKLLVIPHHVLHYLPFVALVVEKDHRTLGLKEVASPRFLLEETFDVFSSPSLVSWDFLRHVNRLSVSNVTVFGISEFSSLSRLKGVYDDVQNVQKAFGESGVNLFLNENATKDEFLRCLSHRGMMIVSTHGENFAENPLESCLFFRTNDGDDSVLTAHEIYTSNIGADLIILNACQTGLGDQTPLPGDDLFGLQRALLHAGSGSVVASLWNVFDRTGPRVIGNMLINLSTDADAAAALADAQRNFLFEERSLPLGAKNEWLHPYFWAVYTLTGDGCVHCAEVENVPVSEQQVGTTLEKLGGESRQISSADLLRMLRESQYRNRRVEPQSSHQPRQPFSLEVVNESPQTVRMAVMLFYGDVMKDDPNMLITGRVWGQSKTICRGWDLVGPNRTTQVKIDTIQDVMVPLVYVHFSNEFVPRDYHRKVSFVVRPDSTFTVTNDYRWNTINGPSRKYSGDIAGNMSTEASFSMRNNRTLDVRTMSFQEAIDRRGWELVDFYQVSNLFGGKPGSITITSDVASGQDIQPSNSLPQSQPNLPTQRRIAPLLQRRNF